MLCGSAVSRHAVVGQEKKKARGEALEDALSARHW